MFKMFLVLIYRLIPRKGTKTHEVPEEKMGKRIYIYRLIPRKGTKTIF